MGHKAKFKFESVPYELHMWEAMYKAWNEAIDANIIQINNKINSGKNRWVLFKDGVLYDPYKDLLGILEEIKLTTKIK